MPPSVQQDAYQVCNNIPIWQWAIKVVMVSCKVVMLSCHAVMLQQAAIRWVMSMLSGYAVLLGVSAVWAEMQVCTVTKVATR
jgi:hypothetical protein